MYSVSCRRQAAFRNVFFSQDDSEVFSFYFAHPAFVGRLVPDTDL